MTEAMPAVAAVATGEPRGPAPPMRWWGWGDKDGDLAPAVLDELRLTLGISGEAVNPVIALEDIELPAIALSDDARVALSAVATVYTDRPQRVAHAAGKSFSDLIRLRAGKPLAVPDAVVVPADEAGVVAVLEIASRLGIAVIPFGGGTSVVGGVTPLRGEHSSAISLDLARLTSVTVDHINGVAHLGAGLRGPAAESALNDLGHTLGHFPQSFEYASIGGFAATRSAGQASTGYGRFDEMVCGLRCVTPSGTLVVPVIPSTAAGPSLRQMILGSEGTLGVITEVSVRVHRIPAVQWYEGWAFDSLESGLAALRRLAHREELPDVARLSDEEETRLSLLMAGSQGALLRRYLSLRGLNDPCLLITGWDGDAQSVSRRRDPVRRLLRAHGAISLGKRPGAAWRKHRFDSPYLRDPLIDRGVLVETLETAATWERLHGLRHDVVAALQRELTVDGRTPLVGAHVSHVYPEGASLYITAMGLLGPDPVATWSRAKAAACEVLMSSGATITHHHAVGTDHAPWLEREIGSRGIAALRALRREMDPQGILNPGKLTEG